MLKFIKGHMESIEGIEIYPMISLLIFFVFFALLFWWVITSKKEHIQEVSRIPLETENEKEYNL
ncbi:CcoQ/FixQ family Cbb3-type cytochrome c oxidase assembly chaperone [Aquimarina algicola]|uniref:CcoQ/FixQ family Cbb3-type cytochrome c oxidase assembly chaperone n=1 Tax=Aquimarina algicola TaxID=2589995 RepID=A0A504JLZ0_9FLAO|nr:CcoQ/FixQ family Cbb3-type cytochrome c oxidase assembly chaperone [Aquimarina algicola]TPN87480.1 CcoQ/FixQ family Cbb3-type cytochrome c oxidase assembly chaperone [Aquimarina algicola]